ncbi:hypothetical protein C8J57DRAFT_1556267 [Mycena rebaudengoi]|nr:hypothetical protein C8J57DRAFT_1556267 [Mycena rebaudengoi]
MKVKKAKEAARTREKQKIAAAQTEIDRMDPEYTPLSYENADLYEKTGERSHTSQWRDKNQITKKARLLNAQPSIANFFKASILLHDPQHTPNLCVKLPVEEHAHVDPDSDIEMILAPDSSPLDVDELSEAVPPIEHAVSPVESEIVSSTEAPDPANDTEVDGAPAPADGVDSDNGYSTGDSDDDKNTHKLSLVAIEDTFKSFSTKIIMYRKSHLSAQVLTAMTPEKGAQCMVTINSLTEFNIQRRKREIERVNLAVKIDNTPRSQRPKLRACLRKMKPSIVASMAVANQFSKTKYWAQKLRSTARSFSETRELPENNQGKGAKHKTHFDDPSVKPRLEAFVRGLVPEAEGGFKGRIAPDKLWHYVNKHLFPELEIDNTIGVTTATAWLKKLGYRLRRYQKGIYYDGHERPDVVQKRNEFIKDMFGCLKRKEGDSGAASQTKKSTSNLKEIPPNLKPRDIIYYPIYHDESTVHTNDQSHFVWETEDQHELHQKSCCCLIYISDFIIEHCGRLVLTLEEIAREELLPKHPLSPAQLEVERIHLKAEAAVAAAAEKERIAVEPGKKPRKKRAPKVTQAQASKAPPATDRTAEGLDWTPPPPPTPFKHYRCEQYDACRIIHPGAGHDPY